MDKASNGWNGLNSFGRDVPCLGSNPIYLSLFRVTRYGNYMRQQQLLRRPMKWCEENFINKRLEGGKPAFFIRIVGVGDF